MVGACCGCWGTCDVAADNEDAAAEEKHRQILLVYWRKEEVGRKRTLDLAWLREETLSELHLLQSEVFYLFCALCARANEKNFR